MLAPAIIVYIRDESTSKFVILEGEPGPGFHCGSTSVTVVEGSTIPDFRCRVTPLTLPP